MIKASPKETRRPGLRCIILALTKAALVGIVAVSTVSTQQMGLAGTEPVDQIGDSSESKEGTSVRTPLSDSVYGVSSARGARYLLRNGLDYLGYGEYQRALKFLRETERRKNELNSAEILLLQKSIENAQRGLREATNAETPYALSDQAGSHHGFSPATPDTRTVGQNDWRRAPARRKSALNQASVARSTVNNDSEDQGEPIRLARSDGNSTPNALGSHDPVLSESNLTNNNGSIKRHDTTRPRQLPEIPELSRDFQELRESVAQPPNTTELTQAPTVYHPEKENLTQSGVDPGKQSPVANTAVVSDDSIELATAENEDVIPIQIHKQLASVTPTRPLTIEETNHLPPLQTAQNIQAANANPAVRSSTTSTAIIDEVPVGINELPTLPTNLSDSAATPHSTGTSVPMPSFAAGFLVNSASVGPNAEPPPKVAARRMLNNDALDTPLPLPSGIDNSVRLPSRIDSIVPNRPSPPSTLRPELKREVETIARKQEDELRRRQQPQPAEPARDTIISDLRAQTQLDISRAPSPAEARPIKAIPVPEDWVSLAPRNWSAQRKYWAAAATCHLPLYFQDPVLERYGHSVEQFVGPIGRYLTYPLDASSQSTQRNQILQPFFSAGLFAFQIAALPYNVIVDPPWEAQYDLGYFRPGDVIPTDIYWLPLHGYGPPLQGSKY